MSTRASIATVLVPLALLTGCRARERLPIDQGAASAHARRSLSWQGAQRDYVVYVPSARGALPVLLVLHGGGGDAATMVRFSGLSELAERKGFIAVYPEGSGRLPRVRTWNAGRCCAFAMQQNVDDVGFLTAVVDDVVRHYGADADRVFATGMSNGAMMAHRLAARAAPHPRNRARRGWARDSS